ncbi:MAG: T9SS type A sorting domain-containing protein, partial [Ignavibacterium sp.]
NNYPVIAFDDLSEGLYRLVYTPTQIGSFNVLIIATDVVNPNNPVVNQEFFIRATHSFYVGENLKPVANSGYKLIQNALAEIQKLLQPPLSGNLTNKEKGKVNSAIRSVQSALNLRNILKVNGVYDYNRLSNYGLKFYDDLTIAINYLNELLVNPAARTTVLKAFDLLYEGSKIFTEFAIEDATKNCVVSNCQQVLASATSELGKALREFDKKNFINVFNHLTNSWKFAQQAMGITLKKDGSDFEESDILPDKYALEQNFPNPFNPATTFNFQLPENNYVSLKIYDIIGNLVATLVDENLNAGYHSVEWNASNLSSGVYLYRLTSGSFISTKKLILMK